MTTKDEKCRNGLTMEENQRRVLTVIYSLSDGRVGVPIRKGDLFAECNRVGIYGMTEEEFEAYRVSVIEAAHVLDAEVVG